MLLSLNLFFNFCPTTLVDVGLLSSLTRSPEHTARQCTNVVFPAAAVKRPNYLKGYRLFHRPLNCLRELPCTHDMPCRYLAALAYAFAYALAFALAQCTRLCTRLSRANNHCGLRHSWGYPFGYLGASLLGWVWEAFGTPVERWKRLASAKAG